MKVKSCTSKGNTTVINLLLLLVALIIVGGALFLLKPQLLEFFHQIYGTPPNSVDSTVIESETPPISEPPTNDAPAVKTIPRKDPAPDHPEPPLPSLDESDEVLRQHLAEQFSNTVGDSPAFEQWLASDHLIQRATALISGLSHGQIQRKILPLTPPKTDFSVDHIDGKIYLSPTNYYRYNAYLSVIERLDDEKLAAFFHHFRPLFEEAYHQLGSDTASDGKTALPFDHRLLTAIDHLLAAPELDTPPVLKLDTVTYSYADFSLEDLSAAHKLLIRMGPENTRMIKLKLQAIKSQLEDHPR